MMNEEPKAFGVTDEIIALRERSKAMTAWMEDNDFCNEPNERRKCAARVLGRAFQQRGDPLPVEIREGVEGDAGFFKATLSDGQEVGVSWMLRGEE